MKPFSVGSVMQTLKAKNKKTFDEIDNLNQPTHDTKNNTSWNEVCLSGYFSAINWNKFKIDKSVVRNINESL